MLKQIVLANLLWPEIKISRPFLNGWFLEDIRFPASGRLEFILSDNSQKVVLRAALRRGLGERAGTRNLSIRAGRLSGKKAEAAAFFLEVLKKNDRTDFLFLNPPDFFKTHPLGIVLTVTHRCNLRCFYCFNSYDYPLDSRNALEDLSTAEVEELIDRLYEGGIRIIIFSGGEPFMRPDLERLVRHALKKKIYCILNTNGTIIEEKKIRWLARLPVHVMLSLHEFNDREAEAANGTKDSFSKKMEFVSLFRRFGGLYLEYATVLSPANIRRLERIYALAKTSLGPDNWQFYRLFETGNNPGSSAEEMIEAIDKISALNEAYGLDYGIVDSVPFCVHPDPDKAARVVTGELHDSHLVKLVSDPKANLKMMCSFESDVGNLKREELGEIWAKPFARKMIGLEFAPEECKRCGYFKNCCGGSRFAAYVSKKSYTAPDPLADFKHVQAR